MKKITEALGVPRTRNFGNFSGGNLAQGPLPRSEQTADNGVTVGTTSCGARAQDCQALS